MPNTVHFRHEEILNFLLRYREEKEPELTFYLRKVNRGNRLNKGFWFQGNEYYIFLSFYKKVDGKNKTCSIGLSIRLDEQGQFSGTTNLEVIFKSENAPNVLTFYEEVFENLPLPKNGTKDESGQIYHFPYTSGEPMEDILFFLEIQKPVIDGLLEKHGLEEEFFVQESEFQKRLKRIEKIKETGIEEEADVPFQPEKGEERLYWLLAPGEHARFWNEFIEEGIAAIGWDYLGDLNQYETQEEIRRAILDQEQTESRKTNDSKACFEFAYTMQEGDIIIAKTGVKTYLGYGVISGDYAFDPDREEYKHVRKVDWKKTGEWEDRDGTIVTKTLTDITKYPDYVARLIDLIGIEEGEEDEFEGKKNYWWLNANPNLWSIEDTPVGQVQSYTTHSESGNKRRIYKYFEAARPGDLIIGYESTPTKKVKAIFEIEKSIHQGEEGEAISFKKIRDVAKPIDWSTLKEVPGLENCEVFANNQGSLFRLTEEEYEIIQGIIDEEDAVIETAKAHAAPYTIEDILQDIFLSRQEVERILRVIKHKKNIILQGPPGVGKTFIAKRLAKVLIGFDDPTKIESVQFHQSFAYEDFIQGIRPDGNGNFKVRKGPFYKFCEMAQHDKSGDYFFIIDEINRGNLSKIFGELMMLVEADKRGKEWEMPLTYSEDGETFFIPENLHIIGTMNTADRSLAMVDYALRRRFAFITLSPNFNEAFQENLLSQGVSREMVSRITGKMEKLNMKISKDSNLGKGFQVGHSYFCLNKPLENTAEEEWYNDIINLEIQPLLEEYWFDKPDDVEQATEELIR